VSETVHGRADHRDPQRGRGGRQDDYSVIFMEQGRGMESENGGARARKRPGWRTPLAVSLPQYS
jgi:hypothetical protein